MVENNNRIQPTRRGRPPKNNNNNKEKNNNNNGNKPTIRRRRRLTFDHEQNDIEMMPNVRGPYNCNNEFEFAVNKHADLSPKENMLIKIFSHLPDNENSKYIAYMKAGYYGNKVECDNLFADERIIEGIKKYKNDHNIIIFPPLGGKGKDSLLTEELTCKLENALSKGMSIVSACNMMGIGQVAFYRWLKTGQDDIERRNYETPYAKFYYRIEVAKPKGELVLLDCIHDAAFGNLDNEFRRETITSGDSDPIEKTVVVRKRQWQAAAWILERTRKKTYSKDGQEQDVINITPEEEAKEMKGALDMLLAPLREDDDLDDLEEDADPVN